MIFIKDEIIKQQLKGFDSVWRRVKSNKKNIQHTAAECGLKFMQKKKGKNPHGK